MLVFPAQLQVPAHLIWSEVKLMTSSTAHVLCGTSGSWRGGSTPALLPPAEQMPGRVYIWFGKCGFTNFQDKILNVLEA